jgi:type VII secretion protein EccB
MRSRREQVEAHRFITSRMNQALVLANPDSIERPLRRIGVSIFASTMVLALIFAGFAIATLFGKGNDDPVFNSIILVKGTSTIYVYTTDDGKEPTKEDPAKLWPVTNYTSALLLLQPYDGKVPVQTLKPESLADKPRGFMVGIDGIPAEPPSKAELLQNQDWNACSMPREQGSTDGFQLTQLVIKDMEKPTNWLSDDKWVLVKTAIDEESSEEPVYFLLWNDKKYEITDLRALDALGLTEAQAVPVNENVINTILPGAPLTIEPEDYFGQPSEEGVQSTDGAAVTYAQPLEISGAFYTLVKDGENGDELAKITETQKELLQTLTTTPVAVDPSALVDYGAQATFGSGDFPTTVLSDTVWEPDSGRPAICAVYDPNSTTNKADEGTEIRVAMYDTAPKQLTDSAEAVEFTKEGDIFSNVEGIAAQTVVEPGRAVLADSRTNSGATIQANTFLIDSLGFQFGIVDKGETDSTQRLLGYGDVRPVSVPDTMISLIPRGADLDPNEARKQLVYDDAKVPAFETEEEAPAEGGGG